MSANITNRDIVDANLVKKIIAIREQWSTADAIAMEQFTGWVRKSVRAGIERGAYMQIGVSCGDEIVEKLGLPEDSDFETIGAAAHRAYIAGGVVSAMTEKRD